MLNWSTTAPKSHSTGFSNSFLRHELDTYKVSQLRTAWNNEGHHGQQSNLLLNSLLLLHALKRFPISLYFIRCNHYLVISPKCLKVFASTANFVRLANPELFKVFGGLCFPDQVDSFIILFDDGPIWIVFADGRIYFDQAIWQKALYLLSCQVLLQTFAQCRCRTRLQYTDFWTSRRLFK